MIPTSQPLAFVDLETTGATAATDRITEVGIIEVDQQGTREWSQLVNPQTPIPEFIQRMTGITDAMVATAPTFAQVASEVLERLAGRLFLAHNARFDYGFLRSEFQRVGIDYSTTVLCTVKLSRRLYPEQARHNLDTLIARHGLRAEGRHRALADAQMIHQFWQLMRAQQPADRLAAVIAELTASPGLPPHLGKEEELPERPGVYLFYGDADRPLFVGRSGNIRKRVLTHFTGERRSARDKGMVGQVRRLTWIVTAGEIGAQLQKVQLINELAPEHNRRNLAPRQLQVKAWPFAGPAGLREADELHVVDQWRYLGTAKMEADVWSLLEQRPPEFDCDIYQMLVKLIALLMPLTMMRPR